MNSNDIISDGMSLEEKLTAIEAAMEQAQVEYRKQNPSAAPIDPAELTMCDSCQ